MSIMVNLLPDVRQAKLRARRRKQLVTGVSIVIWGVCGALIVILSLYTAGQKVIISTKTHDIADKKQKLQAVPGILDAYNGELHLAALPALYSQREYMTKFFQAYTEANPAAVVVSSLSIDSQRSLAVNGIGASYAAVAKLSRALEALNVTVGSKSAGGNTPYFSGVNITNVTGAGKGVTFTINASLGSEVTHGDK